MDLNEISYLTNLDSPLAQAKSLANHGQEITKENYKKNDREKTREKNEGKTLKKSHLPRRHCCPFFTASASSFRAPSL